MSARPRALLCAIARDEGPYLAEWIAFHLGLGFARIVIYDNESAEPITPALAGEGAGSVEVRPWPSTPGQAPQAPAYEDCLRRDGAAFDWMMFLDIDEFLNLKRHDTVGDFLADYARYDGVALNWRIFGSSGLQEADGRRVTERFLLAAPRRFGPNTAVKTVFKPASVLAAGVHSPTFRLGSTLVNTSGRKLDVEPNALQPRVRFDVAQVNHYFVKSRAEFARKRARGRADVAEGEALKHRPEGEFAAYDRNEVEDASILRLWAVQAGTAPPARRSGASLRRWLMRALGR